MISSIPARSSSSGSGETSGKYGIGEAETTGQLASGSGIGTSDCSQPSWVEPLRFLRIAPEARAAEADPCFGRGAGHLGEDQSHAAESVRGVVHEVPVGEIAVDR